MSLVQADASQWDEADGINRFLGSEKLRYLQRKVFEPFGESGSIPAFSERNQRLGSRSRGARDQTTRDCRPTGT